MKTTLIVRVDCDIIAQSELRLQFPAIYESHAIDRAGEDVVFARSSVPGIWEIHAIGRFATWARQDDAVEFRFADIRPLSESITVVTEGDTESDRDLAPYLIDVLRPDELPDPPTSEPALEQTFQTPIGALAEGHNNLTVGELVGGLHFEAQGERFFHRVAAAYSWRCAISRIHQSSIDGLAQEGVVIGLEEPFVRHQGEERDGLFLSTSFAFAYRYGLLAIGDDYEILRHHQLSAEMRMFLEVTNHKAVLGLPGDAAHWPDFDAARRHRRKFSY